MGDERQVIDRVADPDGRCVVLLERVWADKVLRDHPEMSAAAGDVLRAIATPDHVEIDPVRPDRRRYFLRGAGPSRWLLAVVSYEQEPARIITAFANRKDPRTWSE